MTPTQAQDVLEHCRIGVFVAQSFAVRTDRTGFDGHIDVAPVRNALDELHELLPIADAAADDELRRGCAALKEATTLVETNDGVKLSRRERRQLDALEKTGVEHLSAALARLHALADLGAIHV